jgi:hypothetical protein
MEGKSNNKNVVINVQDTASRTKEPVLKNWKERNPALYVALIVFSASASYFATMMFAFMFIMTHYSLFWPPNVRTPLIDDSRE